MGKVATSPLPHRGSPPLQSGGQNQKWPTSGQNGYLTTAVSGIPTASERGRNQKWPTSGQSGYLTAAASGIPTASDQGGKIRRGPQVGKLATSPLPYQGSPPLQSGGQNHKWPTSGQSGYLTAAASGIPTASDQGGKIRSGPQVGKLATSPLPYRGSPPLQSGGQNQKWPTSGQSGYLTPAVSGIPTSAEWGAKSEVAHKWAKWLPHPCRIGDPHSFRSGGKIRSGPQVRKMATSPLPYQGSAPLQSGGQNQKWSTSGQNAYVTPAVSGIPTSAERGAKSEVAHNWAKWLPHPCRIGDPHRFRAGAKSEVAHKWAKWLPHPCRIGDPHRLRAGGKISSGPQVSKMATSPLPYRGSPPPQSGGQNQKWPTSGQNGYLTPAVSGIPFRFRAGGKIRSGPQVGKVATSFLPYRGSPPLQGGGRNQKWPTSGENGYLTPAVSGIPTASERGAKSEVAHKWAKWLPHSCRIRDPHRFRAGGEIRSGPQVGKVATSPLPHRGSPPLQSRGAKSEVAHKWAKWLLHPCRIGDPNRLKAGGKIRSGPQVGKVATSPLPHRGSPPLQSGGRNQKWPTSGQSGYLTPAVSGIPDRLRAAGKIRSRPQVGKMATSPLPHRGSPPLQSGGQNQKWPTSGQNGYLTAAASGIPTASERGAKSEVAHKWANWLPHPCRIGDPPRFRSGGQSQKWPTTGQNGYLTPAVSGIPTVSERGAKSEVAHKCAKWLRHPCRIGDPHCFRAGNKIRSGPQVGKMATSPLPYRGSPPLQSGGRNQKWCPKEGRNCCVTPVVPAIPKKGGIDMAHVRPGQKSL